MEVLRVEHLTKIYGKGENEVKALDNVSFTVEQGEFVAIIGPSGSGKSTMLHMLGGVDKPTRGKVFVGGQDVYAQNEEQLAVFRRRKVGLIYQFYNLIPVLSAEENITLPVLMDGKEVNQERLEELLNVLGLQERRKNLPNQLSGGQQQRVFLARALVQDSEIYFLDEPLKGVDAKTEKEIMKILKELRDNGKTIIIVHHDLRTVEEYFDEVVLLNKLVITSGSVKDVFTEENINKAYRV